RTVSPEYSGFFSPRVVLSRHASPKLLWTQSSGMEADAIRELRTAIIALPTDAKSKVILISSAAAGEGKTTTALNLAAALAQQGPTCLVEGDLRSPVLRDALALQGNLGTAEVIAA